MHGQRNIKLSGMVIPFITIQQAPGGIFPCFFVQTVVISQLHTRAACLAYLNPNNWLML